MNLLIKDVSKQSLPARFQYTSSVESPASTNVAGRLRRCSPGWSWCSSELDIGW